MSCRAVLVLVIASAFAIAQGPPPNGPRRVDVGWFALTGARVVVSPGVELDAANVVVRDGEITAVGATPPPAGATVIDCKGLTIYPGLIDPFVTSDVPAVDPNTDDQHWNPLVQPHRRARDGALVAAADREVLRSLGFTTVACVPTGGILKGSSCVVLLDEPEPTRPVRIVRDTAYFVASFQTRNGYPDSEMGAIALLRQTLLDADWYARCATVVPTNGALPGGAPRPSAPLQALASRRDLPLWFDVQDELEALRAMRIAAEFSRTPVIVGSGMEFRRLQALAATKANVVVPLFFPDAPTSPPLRPPNAPRCANCSRGNRRRRTASAFSTRASTSRGRRRAFATRRTSANG